MSIYSQIRALKTIRPSQAVRLSIKRKIIMKITYNKVISFFTQSSADPKKLSMTLRGIMIGALPLILFLISLTGSKVTEIEAVEIIEQVAILASVVVTLFGLGRKIALRNKQ